jgi:hypothetical protein
VEYHIKLDCYECQGPFDNLFDLDWLTFVGSSSFIAGMYTVL